MKRILLFGAPGSGKGTMADFLQDEFHYLKVSTGDLIRDEIKSNSELGQKVKRIVSAGELVPDQWILDLLQKRLEQERELETYILDGYPRTIPQAESLSEIKVDDESAFYLKVSEEAVVDRLVSRLTCSGCGAIYNKRNMRPKKDGVCDQCGSALERRTDDVPETIRQRIEVYEKSTLPVIEYYERKGILITLDASGTPDEVYRLMKQYLK